MQLNYSFIIPVFNRPQEIRELLESMLHLKFPSPFEVVIVEDGSTLTAEDVVEQFRNRLQISYFKKPNTGPGNSRNFGMKKARGNYFLILDSDVILPPEYLAEVDAFLSKKFTHCFGGPDAAHKDFSDLQKAINYSMTSFLTTGGIRGKERSVDKFQPRRFNMGMSKEALETSGGFGKIHPGEDPDLSLRLQKLNFETILISNAYVYHKRRIDLANFFVQVRKFGKVRPILNKWHPGSGKITYWFPALFMLGLALSILLLFAGIEWLIFVFLVYFIIIGIDAGIKNKSLIIGLGAIVATFIQFLGYGTGFLESVLKLKILKQEPKEAFPKLFFQHGRQKKNTQPLD